MFSTVLIADWHMRSRDVALSLPQEAAARWIAANTPDRSVFITDAFINSPVDLAGRLRITTFSTYVSNLGYDPAPREVDTKAIYCDGPDVAAERMAKYGATYVLSSGGPRATTRPPPTSPRATGSRRSTTRTGSRSGGWPPGRSASRGVQPLGSTTIVTSGVMPVKTLIATLYVPSVLSGSSRSILWRSTSIPRRASASAMSLDVIEP